MEGRSEWLVERAIGDRLPAGYMRDDLETR